MRLLWIGAAMLAFAKDAHVDMDVDEDLGPAPAPAPSPVKKVDKHVPTPAPKPVQQASATRSASDHVDEDTTESVHRRQLKEKVDNTLRSLAGQPGSQKVGAWLYADYQQHRTETAIQCSQLCEDDEKCYRWNFHVENAHCDLKNNNGGYYSNDHVEWVTGSSSRATTAGEL